MTVENERLKLLPHSFRYDENGRRFIEKPTGEVFAIPDKYLNLVELTEQGVSLAQMARFIKPYPETSGRFALISRFLGFLHDRGLLADRRAIRLAEALKPDYVWRESIAFDPIFSFELFRFPGGKPIEASLRKVLASILVAAGAISVLSLARDLHFFIQNGSPLAAHSTSSASILFAFLFSFSVTRSIRALLQSVNMRLFAGNPGPLSIRADCVSVSVATDDLSKVHASLLYIYASAGAAMMMAGAAWIAKIALPSSVASFVPAFTMLAMLSDLSPFRRSALTEWFRALYNYWDRKRGESHGSTELEAKVRSQHLAAAFAWCVLFVGFLVGPARVLAAAISPHLSMSDRGALVTTAALILALFIIGISFIDDLASSWMSASAERVRQMWRRKARPQMIEEAIRDGHVPAKQDLEKLPVIRQLGREMREHLLSRAHVLHLHEGEAACRQGESDRSLFIVLSGRLAVAKSVAGRRRKIVAFLDSGAVFGEAAFFMGKQRTADVIAVDEARVLLIPYDPRMSKVDGSSSEELQFRIWFLQALVSSPAWKDLPADSLDALVFAGKKQTVRAGEKVISEGEVATACFFLIQGQATVTQKTKTINRMKAGDVFGEIALIHPETLRTATVIADSDLLLVRIETERFWHLLGSHLPLGLEVERLALQRLENDRKKEMQY